MDDSMLILLVLLPASISDLTHYKISNAVIINGLILSLFFRCCTNGIREIVPWCLGILIPFLIGFIFYLFRAFGASDIKLLSVVGSFYGIQTCMLVFLCIKDMNYQNGCNVCIHICFRLLYAKRLSPMTGNRKRRRGVYCRLQYVFPVVFFLSVYLGSHNYKRESGIYEKNRDSCG